MTDLILKAFIETILMVACSSILGALLGTPLAVILFVTSPGGMSESKAIHRALELMINSARSVPYIILTVLLMPFTRWMTGSSIGTLSAMIPLSLSAILLTTRVIQEALVNLPKGLIETGISMGASKFQIISKLLLPEALPNVVSGVTLVLISLIGFSAMAGAVGGGGLGDLAIRYGYQRYNLEILLGVVLLLIVLVQMTQFMGDQLAKRLRK